MISASGAHCWPDGDDDQVITLRDVGGSLGRLTRFAGHTDEFYPVLAHCLVAALLCPPRLSVYGLFHDAPEALTNDVPTPWKSEEQKALEHELYGRMCRAYGLPWPIPPDDQAEIERIDRLCLVNEAHFLGHADPGALGPDELRDPAVEGVIEYHFEQAMRPIHGHPLPAFFHPRITGPIYEDAFKSYARKSVEAGLDIDLEKAGIADDV